MKVVAIHLVHAFLELSSRIRIFCQWLVLPMAHFHPKSLQPTFRLKTWNVSTMEYHSSFKMIVMHWRNHSKTYNFTWSTWTTEIVTQNFASNMKQAWNWQCLTFRYVVCWRHHPSFSVSFLIYLQSEGGNYDFMEIYEGPMEQKTKLKTIQGSLGSILHRWEGTHVILRWRTDGGTTKNSMTANVDF